MLYYQEFINNYPANPSEKQKIEKDAVDNEMNALNKAAVFYNTPSVAVLDSLGNAFLSIENNLGGVSKDAFKDIVSSSVTSENVWNLLIEKGYLLGDQVDADIAYVTVKFNPYRRGFKEQFINDLSESLKPFGEAILNLLRQNRLTSYHLYDIQGRLIESIDPRLYYANVTDSSGKTSYYNFKYQYPMGDDGKNPSLTDSADAGVNLSLNNILGSFLWNRSPRNFDQVIEYDRLQRKTKIQVKGLKNDGTVVTDNLVETFVYGESQPNAEVNNLRGKLYFHQDQSGQIVNSKYNLDGQLLVTSRQFTVGYKDYINWDTRVNTVELEKDNNGNPKLYITQYSFNALQQLISETTPDDSVTTNGYNREGLLDQVSVKFRDGTVQNVITNITYDANRQRTKVIYGNGVNTSYCYEDTTLHLIKLYSTRGGKDAQGNDRKTVIQDISYVYDPVGNITRSYDHSYETVFYNNQMVEPLSDYTYDALYRLIKSKGRQHPGINVNTDRNNEKDGDFKQSKYVPLSDSNALENYQESYGYDEAGNLIKTSHFAANSWTRTHEIMPNCNRLKSVKSGNGVNDSYEVSYDDSGNMKQLNVNSNVDLIWNCCDNLVKVGIIQRPDELDDCDYYTYDSDEMRTRKVSERLVNGGVNNRKEEKRYLGNYEEKYVRNETDTGEQTVLIRQSLRVMDGQSCVAIIHYFEQNNSQREVEQVKTRSVRFQLGNNLGSVALEVDKDGDIISYEEYFPYGGTALMAGRNQREVKLKEYRYSGKERDDSTGLYYYGARYYAPWLGRWISADPAGTVDGLNLYAFVGGNPVTWDDGDGKAITSRGGETSQEEKIEVSQHTIKKDETGAVTFPGMWGCMAIKLSITDSQSPSNNWYLYYHSQGLHQDQENIKSIKMKLDNMLKSGRQYQINLLSVSRIGIDAHKDVIKTIEQLFQLQSNSIEQIVANAGDMNTIINPNAVTFNFQGTNQEIRDRYSAPAINEKEREEKKIIFAKNRGLFYETTVQGREPRQAEIMAWGGLTLVQAKSYIEKLTKERKPKESHKTVCILQ